MQSIHAYGLAVSVILELIRRSRLKHGRCCNDYNGKSGWWRARSRGNNRYPRHELERWFNPDPPRDSDRLHTVRDCSNVQHHDPTLTSSAWILCRFTRYELSEHIADHRTGHEPSGGMDLAYEIPH